MAYSVAKCHHQNGGGAIKVGRSQRPERGWPSRSTSEYFGGLGSSSDLKVSWLLRGWASRAPVGGSRRSSVAAGAHDFYILHLTDEQIVNEKHTILPVSFIIL